MIRQANRQKTIDRVYADAVIRELQKKLQIEPAAAERMFFKYYRALKRTWGFELNSDVFADKIIDLHKIFNTRVKAGTGVDITKKIRSAARVKRPSNKFGLKAYVDINGASVPVQLGVGTRGSNLKKKTHLLRPRG